MRPIPVFEHIRKSWFSYGEKQKLLQLQNERKKYKKNWNEGDYTNPEHFFWLKFWHVTFYSSL